MNNLGLWFTSTSPGCELGAINAMNNLRLSMIGTLLGQVLSLDAIYSSHRGMIHMILGYELKDIDDMKNLGLWMI